MCVPQEKGGAFALVRDDQLTAADKARKYSLMNKASTLGGGSNQSTMYPSMGQGQSPGASSIAPRGLGTYSNVKSK